MVIVVFAIIDFYDYARVKGFVSLGVVLDKYISYLGCVGKGEVSLVGVLYKVLAIGAGVVLVIETSCGVYAGFLVAYNSHTHTSQE